MKKPHIADGHDFNMQDPYKRCRRCGATSDSVHAGFVHTCTEKTFEEQFMEVAKQQDEHFQKVREELKASGLWDLFTKD